MDESHFALILLVVSLGLMIAEVFIPSGGMLTILVIVCLSGSLWCAWNAWWVSNPAAWWSYLLALIVLIPGTISGALYALPRTSFGQRVLLEAPNPDEVTPYAKEYEQLAQQVGRMGTTSTLLNPGGIVLVDGKRYHCESEGMLIEPETEVRVVAVKGQRLLVRPTTFETDATAGRDFPRSEKPPLDFDIPQS